MPQKKKKPAQKPKKERAKKIQTLQISPKVRPPSRNRIMSYRRRRFLVYFEQTFGNISAACELAGIPRITFYRWMKSNARVNVRFRERLNLIQPEERKADFIDGKMMQLVQFGVPQVVIHADKYHGKNRAKTENAEKIDTTLSEIAALLKQFLQDKPEFPKDDAIRVFAKKGGVEPQELGKLVN